MSKTMFRVIGVVVFLTIISLMFKDQIVVWIEPIVAENIVLFALLKFFSVYLLAITLVVWVATWLTKKK